MSRQIVATLAGMLIPLGLGMAIRHFRPGWASKLERPGMLLGYLAARLGGLPSAQRRAVAFETGIQNTPVVIAVVLASFPGPLQQAVLHMPLVYAMFALLLGLVVTVALHIADRSRAALARA